MCECDPLIRTPFCGAPGCEWPPQTKEECVVDFQKGDIVEAFGLRGKVVDQSAYQYSLPIRVEFEDGSVESFRADGKLSSNHKIPSLKLIERPKKKVNKKFWIIVHNCEVTDQWLNSTKLYTTYPNQEPVNCQVVEIELEVEE